MARRAPRQSSAAIAVMVDRPRAFQYLWRQVKGRMARTSCRLSGLMIAADAFLPQGDRPSTSAAIGGLLLLSWGIYAVRDNVAHFGAATFNSVVIDCRAPPIDGVSLERVALCRTQLPRSETPISLDERQLQLWANAIDVISVAPDLWQRQQLAYDLANDPLSRCNLHPAARWLP